MSGLLVSFLSSQPMMQIVRGLMMSSGERHLRDLASQYSLSPSGVSDILRRLKAAGVLTDKRVKNRRCFNLLLAEEERRCLHELFSIYEKKLIADRAARFSEKAVSTFEWMDEAYHFYNQLKKSRHDSA